MLNPSYIETDRCQYRHTVTALFRAIRHLNNLFFNLKRKYRTTESGEVVKSAKHLNVLK
jgi:hypothetical protein